MKQKETQSHFKKYLNDFIESESFSATAGKFMLMTIALGGIAITGPIVPGLIKLIGEFKQTEKYTKDQIKNAFSNLKRRKLIKIIEEGEKIKVHLTNKGTERFKEYSFESLAIKKPSHWDGKWRILIFDIPTKPKIYNLAREAFRKKIKELGFFQMQKSVWIYPFECEDELLLIAEIFQVQKYIEILTVEKLLHEKELKAKFEL